MTATPTRGRTRAFRHGRSGYRFHGCRCTVCDHANIAYNRRVVREKRYGRWQPYVDAEPVRAHAQALVKVGIGWRQIAEITGVSGNCVSTLLYTRRSKTATKKVRAEFARRVLAIPVTPEAGKPKRADVTGTRRRLEAMAALGWSLSYQAERLGWLRTNLHTVLRRKFVYLNTACAVAALYDELSMQPAPVGRGTPTVLRAARRNGWFPPLAWDDDTIDNPAAVPCLLPPVDGSDPAADEWAIQHLMADHEVVLDRPTRVEVVRRLIAAGWSYERVAAQIGRSVSFTRDAVAEINRAAGAASDPGVTSCPT